MNVWLFVYEEVKSARQKTFERRAHEHTRSRRRCAGRLSCTRDREYLFAGNMLFFIYSKRLDVFHFSKSRKTFEHTTQQRSQTAATQ